MLAGSTMYTVCITLFSNCSGAHSNNGCNGGNMYNSFMYIIDNEGIDTSPAYPYQGMVRHGIL